MPTIEAPTDAIIKVIAGLHLRLGPVALPRRERHHPGRHDRPRDGRRGRGGRLARSRSFRPGDFVIVAVLPQRQHLPALPAGVHVGLRRTSASPPGGQGEYAKVTQAEGSLVSETRRHARPALIPSLLTLSDVLADRWHCAVAAGVQPGDTVVVVGDGAVGLCGVLAAPPDGCRAGHRDVAARAPPGDRPPVRRDPHRRRARQGGSRADQGAHRRCRRGRGARVRRHRRLDAAGVRVAPARARRSASSASRTASSCRWRGCSARTSGSPAGWLRCARYLPDLLELVTSGCDRPGPVFDMRLPLDEVAEGYRAMDERRAIKVYLDV